VQAHTALPTQAALARFLQQGFFARHVRRMRAVYQARHQRIVDVLTDRFAGHLQVIPAAAGLHLAATAAAPAEELAAVLGRASAAGVALLPLSMYGVDRPTRPGLVVGYGAIPTERLDEGLRRLRRCFPD
jgi:GntR family transcriptional regulator/MocR family aminotransferase